MPMRAAVLNAPRPATDRPLTIVDVTSPDVGPGDVLIDVTACAVCRTDLQLCEGDLRAQILPIVPGHQVVGTVAARGEHVADVEVGDRVGLAWTASTCGRCRFCTSGRENLCESSLFTGWHCNGGFAEQVVARSEFVHLLPDAFDAVSAAPLLCGGAIGLRSLRVSGIRPGGRLGLYGFGASATCVLQIARHWGCEVSVVTRSAAERRSALDLGAAWVGGYDETPPAPLDAAITFAPVGSVVVAALQALDRGGVVAINAIHLDHIPQFNYEHLWWERQLRSVANVTRTDVVDLIELAGSIPIRTKIEEFTLSQSNEALQALSDGRLSGTAVLHVDT
jgi:propanol-preferring alcohol dehydrogenase